MQLEISYLGNLLKIRQVFNFKILSMDLLAGRGTSVMTDEVTAWLIKAQRIALAK